MVFKRNTPKPPIESNMINLCSNKFTEKYKKSKINPDYKAWSLEDHQADEKNTETLKDLPNHSAYFWSHTVGETCSKMARSRQIEGSEQSPFFLFIFFPLLSSLHCVLHVFFPNILLFLPNTCVFLLKSMVSFLNDVKKIGRPLPQKPKHICFFF